MSLMTQESQSSSFSSQVQLVRSRNNVRILELPGRSIQNQRDLTSPGTRMCNRNPRVYLGKRTIALDSQDDLFSDALQMKLTLPVRPPIISRVGNILRKQNDRFDENIRQIERMSQEQSQHLEDLERGLKKLKTIFNKRKVTNPRAYELEKSLDSKPEKEEK